LPGKFSLPRPAFRDSSSTALVPGAFPAVAGQNQLAFKRSLCWLNLLAGTPGPGIAALAQQLRCRLLQLAPGSSGHGRYLLLVFPRCREIVYNFKSGQSLSPL